RIARSAHPRRVRRRWITRSEDVQVRLGIVRPRDPDLRAPMLRRVQARPGVEPRIPLLHRYRVELPLQIPALRIEGLQKSRCVQIVTRPHQYMIADHYWCRRREVLLVEVRDLSVPALLARLRVERNEIVVRRLEEQPVAVHRHATIADVRAPARLPPVVPENVPVQRLHRPRI